MHLDDALSDADLRVLLMHDNDAFNRWEAGQRLLMQTMVAALHADAPLQLGPRHRGGAAQRAARPAIDPALKELLLTPPSEATVAERVTPADPGRIHALHEQALDQLVAHLLADWSWAFETHAVREGYRPESDQAGRRALANQALAMLVRHAVRSGDPVWPGRALQRFKDAGNMTDRLGALSALVEVAQRPGRRRVCSACTTSSPASRWSLINGSCCRPAPANARAGCSRACAS